MSAIYAKLQADNICNSLQAMLVENEIRRRKRERWGQYRAAKYNLAYGEPYTQLMVWLYEIHDHAIWAWSKKMYISRRASRNAIWRDFMTPREARLVAQ